MHNKTPYKLTNAHLDTLIYWGEQIAGICDFTLQVAIALVESLREVKRVRFEMRNGREPLDWDDLIRDISHRDTDIARLLARSELWRFTLGRLWLKTDDVVSLKFRQDWIAEFLEQKFGAAFKIRIRHRS